MTEIQAKSIFVRVSARFDRVSEGSSYRESTVCCLRYTVSFDWQAKMNRVPAGFKASNGSQRVKYLHPVSILIEIRVLVTKKCLKISIF